MRALDNKNKNFDITEPLKVYLQGWFVETYKDKITII